MSRRAKRGFLFKSVLLLAAVGAATAVAPLAALPQAESLADAAPYLAPQRLIRVSEGRTINLICLGHGSPTVVLNAGLGSWSVVWRWVQPTLARRTRVCAWDAAGFGFSSPSSDPQDAVHLTQYLEQTLKEAQVDGPYVMVGHSAGAFVALRFADRYPKSVVGMALVDPAILEQDAVMKRVAPKFALVVNGLRSQQAESLRRCAAGLQSGTLKRGTPEFDECTAAPHMPPAFSTLETALSRLNADPARLLTQASSLDNFVESQREAINPQRRYGAMPLIVLTAGRRDPPPDAPADAREQMPLFYREAARAHEAFAALSTHGEAVLAAINRVLAECEMLKQKK